MNIEGYVILVKIIKKKLNMVFLWNLIYDKAKNIIF